MAIRVGFSLGSRSQLRTAPSTGIINFHMLRVDSFTPGRFNNVDQIEIDADETKNTQPNDNQYSIGKGP